ncbi:prepilin-type N-terminal cleavage/methylation domain-containing protein [Fusibacter sp. A1]|nr:MULTISPECIES: prepilin-type N-terminal cleavage/methylation domain-containing protein [unclassified Fusibacter]NPE21979.1 prepilin-type N-terminal cleavage/methylation domain-containing protein [Fusibacter sp. A1]
MKVLQKKRKGGFTLIELIVVIAILAILAAIAIPRLGGFTTTAKINADKQTYDVISRAVAIGVANGTITADVTITSAETTGLISGLSLIDSNATFKVANNINHSFTWEVDAATGAVTPPIINSATGVITPD